MNEGYFQVLFMCNILHVYITKQSKEAWKEGIVLSIPSWILRCIFSITDLSSFATAALPGFNK